VAYDLGVDLGGTSVAAATAHGSHVQSLPLGDRTDVVPTVVHRSDDGSVRTGEAAAALAVEEPDRIARELKRRLGSSSPVRLAGSIQPAATLLAAVLTDVVARATEQHGAEPERIVLAHPAHWGPRRRAAFAAVPREAGLAVSTISEPEAAITQYAASGRLPDGATAAVYDLGGGTFDATVLRWQGGRAEILGRPEGIEQLGGGNFDEAVLAHVNAAADGALTGLDMRNPQNSTAVARLRRECVLAKEALSAETEATITVALPGRRLDVRLSRTEFEKMIHTPIETTVMTLIRALESASVNPTELAAVLLVGGSARIPLVARMISAALACPTVLDPQPEQAVALGAAALAGVAVPLNPADSAPTPPPTERPPTQRPPTERPPSRRPAGAAPPAAEGPPLAGAPTPITPAAAAAMAGPPDRPDSELVTAAVTTRGGQAAAAPGSLFEPAPRTTPLPPEPPADAGTASGLAEPAIAGRPATAAPAPAPTPGPGPTFESAVTTAFPVQLGPATAPRPGERPPDPFLGGAPAGRQHPAPPAEPPPSTAADRPRRRRIPLLLVTALIALVALLIGAGYLVWNRAADPDPSAAPPPAPAPENAPSSVPTPAVGGTVRVGNTPGFVVVAPDGRQALVANQAAGTVTVVDTATDAVTATIPVGAGPPQYLSFSPDGRTVYVSIWDQARTIAAVGVLDTATNTMQATIPVRTRPYLSAVTPDGTQLYVPNHDSGTISVIDTASAKVITEIRVAPNPHWVEMSDDGTRAYVANHESNLVSIVDTSDNTVLAEVPVQASPHSLAVHPTRPLVANVNYDAASVTMIDTNTDQVVATIAVGKNPQDITWAPDGRHAYVVNTSDSTLSVINADTATVTATIPTGKSPTSVAVLPDGTAALVSNVADGTLTVLDIDG